jgi:SAM-dependent methyltransferase
MAASELVRKIGHLVRKLVELDWARTGLGLTGDRDVEWSWIASQMPSGPGEALDFGSGGGRTGIVAVQRGFNVTAVDLEWTSWPYSHPRLRFVQGDILKLSLPEEHFDLVINCSTVEHVGLPGRYGVREHRRDGDLEAMGRLRSLMKPGAVMLLTIPVGRDAVFVSFHRVYGAKRLPALLEGYAVEGEEYWVKNSRNTWVLSDKCGALAREAGRRLYALGCFVLRRPSA